MQCGAHRAQAQSVSQGAWTPEHVFQHDTLAPWEVCHCEQSADISPPVPVATTAATITINTSSLSTAPYAELRVTPSVS